MKKLALLLAFEVVALLAFVAGYDAGWNTKRSPDNAVGGD